MYMYEKQQYYKKENNNLIALLPTHIYIYIYKANIISLHYYLPIYIYIYKANIISLHYYLPYMRMKRSNMYTYEKQLYIYIYIIRKNNLIT